MNVGEIQSGPKMKEFYEYTVHQLEREHGLINNRVGWMLAAEGFLFTAFGVVTRNQDNSALGNGIALVGFLISVYVFLGVLAAERAVSSYKKGWMAKPAELRNKYPAPSGDSIAHWMGLVSTVMIPITIGATWIFLGVCS